MSDKPMRANESLFAALHKWARQQDENFCTEGLIYLLNLMLREAPIQALEVIGWLTDGLIGPDDQASMLQISGQISDNEGRPDIEIAMPGKTVWIEVKVDSKVAPDQLERYRRGLQGKTGTVKLILLSRWFEDLADGNRPDCSRRWIDLGERFQRVLRRPEIRPGKVSFVLEDYLAFLGTKQMKLNAVTDKASQSVAEVGTILTQLKLACDRCNIGSRLAMNRGWIGYALGAAESIGSIGFNLYEPQWLFYTTDGAKAESRIDYELAHRIDLPGAAVDGKFWTNSIDLVGCQDYLSASAADQVEYLRQHIEASLDAFKLMIVPKVAS